MNRRANFLYVLLAISIFANILFVPSSLYLIHYLGGAQYVFNKLKSRSVSTLGADKKDDVIWINAKQLSIGGKGWKEEINDFHRLPQYAQSTVPGQVWRRSVLTAGLYIHFVTNSPFIKAKWRLSENVQMPHMATTGTSGLDLYAKDKGDWRWAGIGLPSKFDNVATLVNGMNGQKKEFLLYLPLYSGIENLELGVAPGSLIERSRSWDAKRPICFYGTSITQGGCVSRPGMSYPSIIGRWLDRPVVNLGFSDSGRMEKEMAELLSEIDADLFIIDCLANMRENEVQERTSIFLTTLMTAKPAAQVLLINGNPNQGRWIIDTKGQTLGYKGVYEKNKNANLFFLDTQSSWSDSEASVDGVHLTDLGSMRMAECIYHFMTNHLNSGLHPKRTSANVQSPKE